MSDANIPALLEELWEVDFETWKDIMFLLSNSMMFHEPREIPLEQHIYHDIIQGCIQRAIAARGWAYQVSISFQGTHFGKIATIDPDGAKRFHQDCAADTPSAAILAAYIEAVRARQ